MINPNTVIKLLSEKVASKYKEKPSEPTDDEHELSEYLLQVLESILKSSTFVFDEQSTLVFRDFNEDEDDSADFNEIEDLVYENNRFTYEYMKKVVDFVDSAKHRTLKSIQHSYSRVRDMNYVYRFRKYLAENGTKIHKLQEISKHVFSEFKRARDNFLIVHDQDLQRWAKNKARELDFQFQASDSWLLHFKRRNGIVSRKVTKIVSTNYVYEEKVIQETVNKFLKDAKEYVKSFGEENTFNSDQSGFNYIMTSGRTLSEEGEKITLSSVSSVSSTSHSYTIQPTISADGKLLSPIYLCLQETEGQFGPRVEENLLHRPNVYVTCSNSGKLTKQLLREWCSEVFYPSAPSKSLLFLDSWSAHNDSDIFSSVFSGTKTCNRYIIPPKTTSLVQPLDCFFFRQYKNIARRIQNRVNLDNIDIDMKHRNNIITLHSLIHNQISAPIFQPMIKYSWYKAGYISQHPGRFVNVNQVCFSIAETSCSINCSQCSEGVFIRCSWCKLTLCFQHFFIDYHYHSNC